MSQIYGHALGAAGLAGLAGLGQVSQPSAPPKETLRSKLAETQERLAACENIAASIYEKLNGPVPPSAQVNKDPEQPSVSALAMDNHSRAMRIRDALEQIASQLA